MSVAPKNQDSFVWCVGKPENSLPPFPKDWASLYHKYHTWLEDAIRMQIENGLIQERTKDGVKVYSVTALVKIIGQYDNLKVALTAMKSLQDKEENAQVNILKQV